MFALEILFNLPEIIRYYFSLASSIQAIKPAGENMHTTIFAASTKLWNQEFIKHAQAALPASYESMRRPEDPRENRVRRSTIKWARAIPSALRPRALVMQFPRVANTLADVWCQPKVFYMLLCQLTVDDRGGRRGFPLEVKRDLAKLKIYFERTHSAADRIGKPKA